MVRLHGRGSAADLFDSRDWSQACEQLDAFNHRLGLAVSGDLFE
jgi:hypothetical protein